MELQFVTGCGHRRGSRRDSSRIGHRAACGRCGRGHRTTAEREREINGAVQLPLFLLEGVAVLAVICGLMIVFK